MTAGAEALYGHVSTGTTTVARAYALRRTDGVTFGFTDHDQDLSFDGVVFRAGTGMTAKAMSQSSGLSVNNTEAVGALSSEAITEQDILSGRFDRAEVTVWLVNWRDVTARVLQFRGTIGELTRKAGGFTAELRGLSETLNRPQGRIFHSKCSAVLGDAQCSFNLNQPGYSVTKAVASIEDAARYRFSDVTGFAEGWFTGGRAVVTSGPATGLVGVIKNDRALAGGFRSIELWQSLVVLPSIGDDLRLEAGCDRSAATCKAKFDNFMNFRGFPDIPGEDWLLAYPRRSGRNDGGSRRG